MRWCSAQWLVVRCPYRLQIPTHSISISRLCLTSALRLHKVQPSSLHNCSICLHKVQTYLYIYIYIFADDVLIADCPIKLQYLLDALGKWCKDNQTMINHDKTKIIHFRQPKKKLCQSRFSCSETPIQYPDSYKYLGVEFTDYLSCVKSVENTAISAKKAASYLIARHIVNYMATTNI